MKYMGPIFGQLGDTYVELAHDSDYYDRIEEENARLREALAEIADIHIESHEDARDMRSIAENALKQ